MRGPEGALYIPLRGRWPERTREQRRDKLRKGNNNNKSQAKSETDNTQIKRQIRTEDMNIERDR
jgi:hypothetical protein